MVDIVAGAGLVEEVQKVGPFVLRHVDTGNGRDRTRNGMAHEFAEPLVRYVPTACPQLYLLFLGQHNLEQLSADGSPGVVINLEPPLRDALAELDSGQLANLEMRRGTDDLDKGRNAFRGSIDLRVQRRGGL